MFKKIVCFAFATIVGAGILGNVVNLVVFSRRRLWKYYTFRLIFYLSMTDLLILILCAVESLVEWRFEIEIRVLSSMLCKVDTFLAYFLLHARTILSLGILTNRKNIYSLFYFSLFRPLL
jgi:hypothetical protein